MTSKTTDDADEITDESATIETAKGTRPRIVIVSPGVPHSRDGASVVLFYHYIRAFKDAGFQILNVLIVEPGNYSDIAIASYKAEICAPGFDVYVNFAECYYESKLFDYRLIPSAVQEVRKAVRDYKPDAIFCMDLLCGAIMADVSIPAKQIWLGDLNYQSIWHHLLYGLREHVRNALSVPNYLRAVYMWRRFYPRTLRHFDSIIVSSKASERALKKIGVNSRYLPYPWPNRTIPPASGERSPPDIPTFYFFGGLTGLGSRSAFHFLIRSLYPRLKRVWGSEGFRIFISGRGGLPPWVSDALEKRPELKYLGFVEDLDGVIAESHAVLVPLDVPVGNRSRIITAMAKRALVIAHENAALGNPALENGVTCFLARTGDEFVARMREAIDNPYKVQDICMRARAYYETNFAPESACPLVIEALLDTMAKKGSKHMNVLS